MPTPGGMRRLLDHQYVNTIGYMFGPEAAAVASPPNDPSLYGYTPIGNSLLAPEIDLVELYEASALALADAAIANPSTMIGFVPCIQDAPEDACYTEFARTFGHLAWRRPLTDDEVSSIVDIALEAQAWDDDSFDAGLKYAIVRILLSPEFIYVTELGEPDPEDPSRRWLTGPEVVTRVSLLLLGRSPSLALLESAEAGNYDSVGAVETLAMAMLEDEKAPEAIAEFFAEYLALDEISGKDPSIFPEYSDALVDSMLMETELLLRDVIWTQNTDFRDFFEADYTFIDSNLATLYGMPQPAEDWDMAMLMDGRAGFLTHASVLARNSHFAENSTTRRGQYIQQRLLCFPIPPPPPEVNPELPEVPEDMPMTLRERMEILHMSVESCASCHQHMDPLAFPLESYDALGAFRTHELNGLPIDPVAEYEMWGTMNDATDLAAYVATDPRLGECIIKNVVRYGRGSLEDPLREAGALADLLTAFSDSSYRFQDLLVAYVTSDMFLQVGDPR